MRMNSVLSLATRERSSMTRHFILVVDLSSMTRHFILVDDLSCITWDVVTYCVSRGMCDLLCFTWDVVTYCVSRGML